MLEAFLEAGSVLANVGVIAYVILGCTIGLVFGALPGLGGIIAIAILLPFTYGMEPVPAMLFLAAVMGAVPFGGSISAILINTPGTAPNAATCFDGFPMARRGEASKALGISATASGLGAIFGLIVLLVFIPLVRAIVLLVGPPEFFMLVLFGLVTVSFAARGNLVKGLVAGGVGILISLIGFSGVFGILRFTYGSNYLWDGIELVSFLIGIFAISELINYSVRGGTIAEERASMGGRVLDGVKEVFRHKLTFLRSSAIGTTIGIIPGVGGAVANFLSYITAKQMSKHPETFGTGDPEGVVASEAANNAKDGGALLPTVGFGIPGSGEMAVLLGGFILHGLTPGPMLILNHLEIVFALFLGILISNILASSFGLLVSNYLGKLTLINVAYIIPVVAVLCFAGAFAIRGNIWDVVLALVSGVFGYGMTRFGFPNVCLVIGFILGFLAEQSFSQSLMISEGNYAIFFSSPISIVLFSLIILVLLLPFIRGGLARRGGNK